MITDSHEKQLLKGLAADDRRAIETIYKENYKMVQAFIINNNGTTDDARDVFQEAMIVLYENAKSASFELNCLIKTYLYSVSRRLWLKRLQYFKKYGGPLAELGEFVTVDDEIEAQEERNQEFQLMEKAMMGLGEPCKSLLEAYYLQKKNMTIIADSFGYTNAANAKTQKYKCLVRLKKLFFSKYKTR